MFCFYWDPLEQKLISPFDIEAKRVLPKHICRDNKHDVACLHIESIYLYIGNFLIVGQFEKNCVHMLGRQIIWSRY